MTSDSTAKRATTPGTGPEPSDEALVVAHLDGSADALPELMRRYQRELLGFLMRFTGSRASAEDVFQEAFLQVHLAAPSFDPDRAFRPWLYTIAANKARDLLRRQKRRRAVSLDMPVGENGDAGLVDLLAGDDAMPFEAPSSRETTRSVQRVLESIPAHHREIILLGYFQRFSYHQIADVLEIPLGTVKSRLHAAVANFARAWRIDQTPKDRPDSATEE